MYINWIKNYAFLLNIVNSLTNLSFHKEFDTILERVLLLDSPDHFFYFDKSTVVIIPCIQSNGEWKIQLNIAFRYERIEINQTIFKARYVGAIIKLKWVLLLSINRRSTYLSSDDAVHSVARQSSKLLSRFLESYRRGPITQEHSHRYHKKKRLPSQRLSNKSHFHIKFCEKYHLYTHTSVTLIQS